MTFIYIFKFLLLVSNEKKPTQIEVYFGESKSFLVHKNCKFFVQFFT